MATLMKVDGTREVIDPANGKKFTYDELLSLVGENFVAVTNVHVPAGYTLIANNTPSRDELPANHQVSGAYQVELYGDVLYCATDEIDW